jgi:hypothetical protein
MHNIMRSSLCSLGLAATTARVPGRVIALLAGLGLLCQAARASNPNLLFTKLPDSHDTATASSYTALADLNGDGRPDLIRTVPDTGGGTGSVGVQLGLGSGSFAAGTYYPAGALPGPIVVADFDNDGKLDVVVANLGTADNGSLSVLLGNGNGTLQSQTVVNLGFFVKRLVVTDYNQDGKADLVAVGYHAGALPLEGYSVTLPGDGNGTFGPPASYVNSARTAYAHTRDVVVGDFNGDTWPDYIVSNPVGQAVAVFFNNHDGTFTRRAREMWLPGNVASLATGDFNGDGKLDLAFITASDTTYGNTGVGNNVGVVDGNGDGTFGSLRTDLGPLDIVSDVRIYSARPAGDTLVRPSSRLVAHDMDGNGTLDLVFLAEPMQGLCDVLSILRGAGNGTFAFGAQLVASYSSVWISVADLNQDSAVDLIVSPNGATTQAYLGIPPGGGMSVVTTALDEDNGTTDPNVGTGTSLREAWNQALTQVTPQTINFAANLAGQTIYLTNVGSTVSGSSALAVSAGRNLTVQGLPGDAGITIDGGGILRPFMVAYDFGGGGSGTLTLNDLTIQNGRSTYGGGVFNLGTLTMRRCTLTRNSASNQGGALYTGASYATGARALLVNCTIANNTGLNPGIMSDSARLDLLNVTITSNSSPGGVSTGGGIVVAGGSTVTLTNTIVAGNSPLNIDRGDVQASSRNNLIGTGGSGGLVNGVNGNLVGVANPRLGPLASNGGPTPTVRLLPGSAALDAGLTVAEVTTDQRGVARPVGAALDIGAYEFAVTPSLVVTTTVDEDNGNSDPVFGTGTSLREALRHATSLSGAQTITFSPALAGQVVVLNTGWNDAADTAALRVAGNLTVQGLTTAPGVTLAVQSGVQKRHFFVEGAGNLTLSHLMLTNGFATDFGGAVWSFGSLVVQNCTFAGNHAGAEGGAIQSWGDSPLLVVENSTFTGNTSAGIASAIDAGAINMTLRQVTITGNTATNNLGALVLWKNQATLVNSIVAGNSDDGLGLVNGGSFSVASVNNLIGTGGTGGLVNGVNGNLVAVPASRLYLAPLTSNGGPTRTIAPAAGQPGDQRGRRLRQPHHRSARAGPHCRLRSGYWCSRGQRGQRRSRRRYADQRPGTGFAHQPVGD